jgi:hypothetical protein
MSGCHLLERPYAMRSVANGLVKHGQLIAGLVARGEPQRL